MYFSFSVIFSFLAIFQVLQCAFLIFHVFQWFRHFSIVKWMFLIFHDFQFLAIFHVLQWTFLNFPPFFSFPLHISRPKVCISHFPWFSVFSPYSSSYSVHFSCFMFCCDFVIFQVVNWIFSFSMIFGFLAIFHVLQ